jgi:T5SS/PEP-CTERM-associated repeat protein
LSHHENSVPSRRELVAPDRRQAAESSITVGKEATAKGTVLFDGLAVSDDAAKIRNMAIGDAGDGKFTLRDGALYETESLLIGNQAGSRGELIVEGTGTDFSINGGNSSIVVGTAGTAIVTVTGGASFQDLGTSGQDMSIGSNAQNAAAEVAFRDGATGMLSEVSIGEFHSSLVVRSIVRREQPSTSATYSMPPRPSRHASNAAYRRRSFSDNV